MTSWGTWGIGGCHTHVAYWFPGIDEPRGCQKDWPCEADRRVGEQGRHVLVSPVVWAGKTEWGPFGTTFMFMFKFCLSTLAVRDFVWMSGPFGHMTAEMLLGFACSHHSEAESAQVMGQEGARRPVFGVSSED